ncbi:MAG: 30S ribosomal protein S12 methylthiotransferase RimO [Epsilonproteobacteria bacterium]|nr:MAG: 30S ribosomal protein S12 methylthiotransferase RimO [Campylobacterota bacterium]
MALKLHLISLGCTKNLVDSEIMLGVLKDYQITNDTAQADVIIINTCGFISSAKEESLSTILEVHEKRKKSSILCVTGCLTQRYQKELQLELPEVDIFSGVGDFDKINKLIESKQNSYTNKVFLNDENSPRVVSNSTYHAYIKIAEGCNQTCSFCAIPSFKGKLQSKSLNTIKAEVENLVNDGYFDFTFISQDSSSYLFDIGLKDGLIKLIDVVEKISGVRQARILYLYPSTTTTKLIDKIGSSKAFFSYFDMPLQHISQEILMKMKRGKGSTKIKELLKHMRKYKDSFIRSTFIVGYPGETKEQFKQLKNFVDEFNFDRVNIFSYSDEEGTNAYNSGDKIKQKTIDKRAKVLGKVVSKQTKKHLKNMIGKVFDVVVDSTSSEHEYLLSAKLTLWAPQIDGEILINENHLDEDISIGKIYKAKITNIAGNHLLGTIIK